MRFPLLEANLLATNLIPLPIPHSESVKPLLPAKLSRQKNFMVADDVEPVKHFVRTLTHMR